MPRSLSLWDRVRDQGLCWRPTPQRITITIDYTKVGNGTENETNFPVLVVIPNLAHAGPGGRDVRFWASDGVTPLACEVESYSGGTLTAWVKVPTLSYTVNTVIIMTCGDLWLPADPASSLYGSRNVWDSNFKGVWHLPNGTTLSADDSTSNANNGTPKSQVSAISGKVGGGANFTGSTQLGSMITLPNVSGSLDISNSTWTMEIWVSNVSTNDGGGTYGDSYISIFSMNSNGMEIENPVSGGNYAISMLVKDSIYKRTSYVSASAWHHFAFTRSGTTYLLYVDGTLDSGASMSDSNYGGAGEYILGNVDSSENGVFGGKMDEARVSNIVRSAGWIKTVYNNQNSPSTFYSLSPTPTASAYEIQRADGLSAWFAGTQSSLSAGHPFKNRPPTWGT